MSKKGGYYCAFKNCRGLSRRDKRSFFRFPKDPVRSKQWVKSCNRNDLLEKTPIELFNSYRVCAKHFTDSMFLNDLRNRLQPNSIPMQLEPPEDSDDTIDMQEKNNKLLDFQNQYPVTKILNNCVLQKISADEFFKATGIRINEPVSTIKATEEYLANSNPSDQIFSSTKANHSVNDNGNMFTMNNDNESNFSIEDLNYQDEVINSWPMGLICEDNAEPYSMKISELPLIISEKSVSLETNPEAILSEQVSALNNISNDIDSLQAMAQTDLDVLKVNLEEITQTEFMYVENETEKYSQTEYNSADNKFEQSTQTEYTLPENKLEKNSQTNNSYLKDRFNKNYYKILQNKKHEIKKLKRKLQKNFIHTIDNITLEQYELLTDKFFPKKTSDFIKNQAQLFEKKNNDHQFTLDFKKQCLPLFLSSPKTYKNLQTIFRLPELQDLETLKI